MSSRLRIATSLVSKAKISSMKLNPKLETDSSKLANVICEAKIAELFNSNKFVTHTEFAKFKRRENLKLTAFVLGLGAVTYGTVEQFRKTRTQQVFDYDEISAEVVRLMRTQKELCNLTMQICSLENDLYRHTELGQLYCDRVQKAVPDYTAKSYMNEEAFVKYREDLMAEKDLAEEEVRKEAEIVVELSKKFMKLLQKKEALEKYNQMSKKERDAMGSVERALIEPHLR
ncbi:hypothetical protein L596_021863 [Steinernema carpocapsae]|uniref:Uncharacterized protein n=1 Tax=Steinernema carpocapsae TaxID=34508 RepID=A0A4U5MKV1_STECR|nr:hypothetical protein L596_021863 [Steinernema carpocapsae]